MEDIDLGEVHRPGQLGAIPGGVPDALSDSTNQRLNTAAGSTPHALHRTQLIGMHRTQQPRKLVSGSTNAGALATRGPSTGTGIEPYPSAAASGSESGGSLGAQMGLDFIRNYWRSRLSSAAGSTALVSTDLSSEGTATLSIEGSPGRRNGPEIEVLNGAGSTDDVSQLDDDQSFLFDANELLAMREQTRQALVRLGSGGDLSNDDLVQLMRNKLQTIQEEQKELETKLADVDASADARHAESMKASNQIRDQTAALVDVQAKANEEQKRLCDVVETLHFHNATRHVAASDERDQLLKGQSKASEERKAHGAALAAVREEQAAVREEQAALAAASEDAAKSRYDKVVQILQVGGAMLGGQNAELLEGQADAKATAQQDSAQASFERSKILQGQDEILAFIRALQAEEEKKGTKKGAFAGVRKLMGRGD